MIAAVRSATVFGVEGRPVTVEVHVATGLPAFQIVGLPDEACRESRDRVRAAVLSSGLSWPSCRVTVNLAPSSQRKGGSGLDLAIAVGFLAANNQLPVTQLEGLGFVGELGLDGSMRGVSGVAPMVVAMGDVRPVVPLASFREAQGVVGDGVRVAATLREVVDALNADAPWPRPPDAEFHDDEPPPPDLADVRGQAMARRGLEVAAAGSHHMLLVGPPGSGKTMLAQRIPGLLPALERDVSLAATMVHSAAGVRLPVTLLVVPRHHGAPSDGRFAAWLRLQARHGHELALHGHTHLDDGPPPRGLVARLLRRVYTAGEGEFAALDRPEAARRLALGQAWARAHQLPMAGFVAPA